MTYRMYALKNEYSGLFDGIFLLTNDRHAQFELSQKVPDDRKSYTSLYCVGSFDINSALVIADDKYPYRLDWTDVSLDSMARKSEISKETPDKQVVDFVDKTSDIGVK